MTLCDLCTKIPAKLFSPARSDQCHYDHHLSRQALKQSAVAGCQLCAVFYHAIESYVGKYAEKWQREDDDAMQLLSSKFGWQNVSLAWKRAGVFRGSPVPEGWENAPALPLERSSSSELLLHEARMIQHWSHICRTAHSSCNHNSSYLPTRLVKLGNDSNETIKLVVTSEEKNLTDRRYLALSHCWGRSMPESAKTPMARLERHKISIKLQGLPKTFQDFIGIAKRLHNRLVWIDSLCIIQDSKEDWQYEAAQMASVYSNAYLTIAASGSSDGTGGCEVDNEWRSYGPVDVDCLMPVVEEGSTEKDTPTRRYRVWSRDPNPVGEVLMNDPLSHRAWCLQERELSPRVVHYSRDTIRWECKESSASLEFPWGDRFVFDAGRLFDGGYAARPTLIGLPVNTSKPLSDETKMRLCWMEVVARYTKRKLTRQTDILPALSGIAKSVAAQTEDIYYCGLWKSYFAHCLLWQSDWHIDRGLATHCRPEDAFLAPSWSWASVKGPIKHAQGTWFDFNATPDPKYTPKLLEISVDAVPDAFGAVRSSTLRLEGRVTVAFSKQERYAQGSSWQDSLLLFMPGASGIERVGYIVYDVPLCEDCAPTGKTQMVVLMCCMDNDPLQDGTVTTLALAFEYTGAPNTVRRVGIAQGFKAGFWDGPLVKTMALTVV